MISSGVPIGCVARRAARPASDQVLSEWLGLSAQAVEEMKRDGVL